MLFKKLNIVNWNIGGAKYLTLRTRKSIKKGPPKHKTLPKNEIEKSREDFRQKPNEGLKSLISNEKYQIITLQECVEYNIYGKRDKRVGIIDSALFPIIISLQQY